MNANISQSVRTEAESMLVLTASGPVVPSHVVRGYVTSSEGYDLDHPNERITGFTPVVVLTSGEHVNVCRYFISRDEAEATLYAFLRTVRTKQVAYWTER